MAPPASAAHDDDVEVTVLPRFSDRRRAAAALTRRLLGQVRSAAVRLQERAGPRRLLPVVGVVAFCIAIGILAIVRALVRHATDEGVPEGLASSRAVEPTPSAEPGRAPSAGSTPPVSKPCVATGSPQVIGLTAMLGAGVEAQPVGQDVALGFASSDHEAVAVRLDPASLTVATTATTHSPDIVRRVRPVVNTKEAIEAAVDVDRKGDRIRPRRALPIDRPLQVGATANDLVWARGAGPPAGKLWTLEGDGEVEALRGASSGAPDDPTYLIVFRRGSAVWMGAASGHRTMTPRGGLWQVAGLGESVGSPTVALNGGVAVVAWADRASAGEPWRVRLTTFKPGEPPGEARAFAPPGGGENAMSPGLAAVPGGGFLLVWTEGPPAQHRVRAVRLSAQLEPVGAALEISADGVNAGQGQAAIVDDGKGVVAYLESADGTFRVVARSVVCARE